MKDNGGKEGRGENLEKEKGNTKKKRKWMNGMS